MPWQLADISSVVCTAAVNGTGALCVLYYRTGQNGCIRHFVAVYSTNLLDSFKYWCQ